MLNSASAKCTSAGGWAGCSDRPGPRRRNHSGLRLRSWRNLDMTRESRNCAANSRWTNLEHLWYSEYLVFLLLSSFLVFWLENEVFSESCRYLLARRIRFLEYDNSPRRSYLYSPRRHAGAWKGQSDMKSAARYDLLTGSTVVVLSVTYGFRYKVPSKDQAMGSSRLPLRPDHRGAMRMR